MLVYKSHYSTDGPNPKLIQPWRGPYIICSKLSPVVYRIRHPADTKQVSVHLVHIKSYRPRQSAPAPDFHKLEGLFLGKTLPTPTLEESETAPPHIGIYQVADAVGHRRGQGRHSPHSYIYRYGSKALAQKLTSNIELTRSHNVTNLLQHPALNIYSRQSRLLLAISGSILLRKTAIPSVAIPHRKTVVPSKANPLFASALTISGSILLRQTVTPSVAIQHRKTAVRSNANPLFASANPDLARIKRKVIRRGESE